MPRTYHVRATPQTTYCGRQTSSLDPAQVRVGPGTATCKRCLSAWDTTVTRRRGLLEQQPKLKPPICPVCHERRSVDARGYITRHVNYLLDHCPGSYQLPA